MSIACNDNARARQGWRSGWRRLTRKASRYLPSSAVVEIAALIAVVAWVAEALGIGR